MEPVLSVCVFEIGGTCFGVSLDRVTAVTRHIRIEGTETSGAPNVIGLTRIRGETMAVVDLNKVLDMQSVVIHEDTLFLIIEAEHHHVCFPVDNVVGHYDVDHNSLAPVSPMVQDKNSHCYIGIAVLGDKLIPVIDTAIIS